MRRRDFLGTSLSGLAAREAVFIDFFITVVRPLITQICRAGMHACRFIVAIVCGHAAHRRAGHVAVVVTVLVAG